MERETEGDGGVVRLLSADDKSICLNRRLFKIKSGYFKGLTNSGMLDAKESDLKFESLFYEDLFEVESYFRTGSECLASKSGRSLERIEAGLNAAFYLQIDDMISLYVEKLSLILDLTNWNLVAMVAEKYFLQSTKEAVSKFLLRNFGHVVASNKLHLVQEEYMEAVLGSDELCISSEMVLFEALNKWLCHHDNCSWMLKLIRLQYL